MSWTNTSFKVTVEHNITIKDLLEIFPDNIEQKVLTKQSEIFVYMSC